DGEGTNIWLYSYVFLRVGDNGESILRLAISTQPPNKRQEDNTFHRRTHAGDLQLMRTSSERLHISTQGGGRVISSTANIQLARTWVDECLQHHGSLCSLPSSDASESKSEGPIRLRVIDVHERWVIDLPNEAQYVALSYCWPRHPGLTNLKSIDLGVPGTVRIFMVYPKQSIMLVMSSRS
ncbi:hypothetical protein T440DRAFT_541602, partial [Plenodomus tracheiphilus IPT5]